jgi:hypothetical protein
MAEKLVVCENIVRVIRNTSLEDQKKEKEKRK